SRKEEGQEIGARGGELVEREASAGELGEDGEEARSGRGFEHEIAGRERGSPRGDEPKADRRRELLQRLALLGAAGLRWHEPGDLRQHCELRGRRVPPDRRAELAQDEELRRLAGLIGILPAPAAFG